MPWQILLTNWRGILLASVIAYAVIMTMHARALEAERNEAIANLDSYIQQARALSDAAKQQSEKAVKEVRNEIPKLVAQAEKSAYQNYLRKYGLGRCDRLPNVPTGVSGAEAEGADRDDAGSPDSIPPEQRLAQDCGKTTVLYNAWRSWAIKNELQVE